MKGGKSKMTRQTMEEAGLSEEEARTLNLLRKASSRKVKVREPEMEYMVQFSNPGNREYNGAD